jgi:hypothetical protein
VADLTFAQAPRRNYAVPVLIAVLILSAVAAMGYNHFSGRTVKTSIAHTEVFPIRVVMKEQQPQGFKVLSDKPVSHAEGIYVLATVHIENHLADPLFLKDFHAVLDTDNGQLSTSAIEQADLPAVTDAFPELKPKLATPLLRESSVPVGKTSDGVVVLQFPITQAMWDARKSAVLTIDLYHQDSITVTIPKP